MQIAKSVDKKLRYAPDQMPVVAVPDMKLIEVLTDKNTADVSDFLKIRPVHTVVMKSFIQDNGLESELNRGTFYGYRNAAGELEGVALIGHTTLVEAHSEEALTAFAMIARTTETPIHVMMSDGNAIENFWTLYKQDGSQPRLKFTEKLFDLRFPFPVQECEWDVRLADKSEIEQIAEAHAEVALIESGVDPMEKDREGFIQRCLRRIEKEGPLWSLKIRSWCSKRISWPKLMMSSISKASMFHPITAERTSVQAAWQDWVQSSSLELRTSAC